MTSLNEILKNSTYVLYVSGYKLGLVIPQVPLEESKALILARSTVGERVEELQEYEEKAIDVPRLDYFYTGVLGLGKKSFCAPSCPLLIITGTNENKIIDANIFPDGTGWVTDPLKAFSYFGIDWTVGDTANGLIKEQDVTLTAAMTMSVHLKKITVDEDILPEISFVYTDDLAVVHVATLNWETGELIGNDVNLHSYGTYPLSEGHFRVWVRFQGSNMSTLQPINLRYPSAEQIELAVSNFQVEDSTVNSQIPTMPMQSVGGALTRDEDFISLPFVSDYFTGFDEGTFMFDFVDLSRDTLDGGAYGSGEQLMLYDASSTNRLVINQINNQIEYYDSNGVLASSPILLTNRVRLTWKGNVCQLWVNGVSVDFIKSQVEDFNPTFFGTTTTAKYRLGIRSIVINPNFQSVTQTTQAVIDCNKILGCAELLRCL